MKHLPQAAPRLPLAPFLVGDLVLVATAVFIGAYCNAPITPGPLLAIALCVIIAAILGAIPLVANYGSQQDAELAERQREIAALARTTAESAEQLSIAAATLHSITEATSRNLQLVEQLPAQLKEHAATLQRQLSETATTAASASKTETGQLDASASQHLATLEAALARIPADAAKAAAKTLADLDSLLSAATTRALSQVDASVRDHLAAIEKTLARFPAATETAANAAALRLTESAATALTATKTEIAETVAKALAGFEPRLAAAAANALPRLDTAPESPPRKRAKHAPAEPAPEPQPVSPAEASTSPEVPAPAPTPEPAAAPAPESKVEASPVSPDLDVERSTLDVGHSATQPPVPEPGPAHAEHFAEKSPAIALDALASAMDEALSSPTKSATSPKPRARKSDTKASTFPDAPAPSPTPKVDALASSPDLDVERSTLDVERSAAPQPPPPDLGLSVENPEGERAITSDGFTRLVATAYIGIGNKLFIRGDGPGLNWDKGSPLQFVSIGKWRWETPDATAPIRAKLYKNDQIECASLGELTLEPGHQHDVNAGF